MSGVVTENITDNGWVVTSINKKKINYAWDVWSLNSRLYESEIKRTTVRFCAVKERPFIYGYNE